MGYYKPSFIAFLLALIFLAFPFLTVFLVVGGLLSFSAIYALVVYKLKKAQRQMNQASAASGYYDESSNTFHQNSNKSHSYASPTNEPTFRNVTVLLKKRGGIFRSSFDQL